MEAKWTPAKGAKKAAKAAKAARKAQGSRPGKFRPFEEENPPPPPPDPGTGSPPPQGPAPTQAAPATGSVPSDLTVTLSPSGDSGNSATSSPRQVAYKPSGPPEPTGPVVPPAPPLQVNSVPPPAKPMPAPVTEAEFAAMRDELQRVQEELFAVRTAQADNAARAAEENHYAQAAALEDPPPPVDPKAPILERHRQVKAHNDYVAQVSAFCHETTRISRAASAQCQAVISETEEEIQDLQSLLHRKQDHADYLWREIRKSQVASGRRGSGSSMTPSSSETEDSASPRNPTGLSAAQFMDHAISIRDREKHMELVRRLYPDDTDLPDPSSNSCYQECGIGPTAPALNDRLDPRGRFTARFQQIVPGANPEIGAAAASRFWIGLRNYRDVNLGGSARVITVFDQETPDRLSKSLLLTEKRPYHSSHRRRSSNHPPQAWMMDMLEFVGLDEEELKRAHQRFRGAISHTEATPVVSQQYLAIFSQAIRTCLHGSLSQRQSRLRAYFASGIALEALSEIMFDVFARAKTSDSAGPKLAALSRTAQRKHNTEYPLILYNMNPAERAFITPWMQEFMPANYGGPGADFYGLVLSVTAARLAALPKNRK